MAKSIGRYEIREELGRGGMATVYQAFDPKLHRDVALKLMDQQLTLDPAFAARFEREARTVAALEHAAIVSLYDYGEVEGWLYLVMPFMRGGSLKDLIAKGPLPPEQATGVIRRIGSALDKAHRRDIIHRDLKPGNILLDEEQEAYLSDFGIVKVAKGDTEYLTQTGQTIGTFAYMSPEQLMGESMDGRSDLYALGIVLYEMLTGKHPYKDDNTTDAAMAVAHTQAPIPDVTRDNPNLSPALSGVIRKALAKDAVNRYATGREMAQALSAALSNGAATQSTTTAGAITATPAVQQSGQAAPQVEQPTVQPRTQQSFVAAPVAERPQAPVSQTEASPAAASQADAPEAGIGRLFRGASPLPAWVLVLEGIATIILGVFWLKPSEFFDVLYNLGLTNLGLYYFSSFYLPVIGLLTGVTIFTRPADWIWRLVVAILGISSFFLSYYAYSDRSQLDLTALIFILVGLIQVVQAFRGAGMALVALGVASLVLGLRLLQWQKWYLQADPIRVLADDRVLPILIICGIATIALAFVPRLRGRRAAA